MEPFEFFRSEKISESTFRIFGATGELMYLVEGSERAALIDTGTGVGNLRALVERLTDKPCFVLLTHGHVDHALGAPAFDDVYMNPADREVYQLHSDMTIRKKYLEMTLKDNFARVKEEDYIPVSSCNRFKPLLPGDVFDLGGIHLEIHKGAGHTPGMITILIVEERVLMLGDAANFFTFLFDEFTLGVTSYEKVMAELNAETKGRYDKVYLSHGSGDAPREMLESIIELCRDIQAGNTDDVPFQFLDYEAHIAKAIDASRMARADGGLGNIVYNKQRIWL